MEMKQMKDSLCNSDDQKRDIKDLNSVLQSQRDQLFEANSELKQRGIAIEAQHKEVKSVKI